MSLVRLTAAASVLALASAAPAQELPRFDPDDFGKTVLSRKQSGGVDAQYEALIGARNIEFIIGYGPQTLFRRTGRAVGRLDMLTDGGLFPCTAFLVDDNHLVTNHHCVPGIVDNPKANVSTIFAVKFKAGFLVDGLDGETQTFDVSPVPVETNKELDYSVLKLLGDANSTYGALTLSDAVPGDTDPFWIIGHPDGRAQQISREKCQASTPAIEGKRVRHVCDTLPGSSGSPVLDASRQQVVALHSAASGSVNLAVPMAEILAQSKVLKAVAPKRDEAPKADSRAIDAAFALNDARDLPDPADRIAALEAVIAEYPGTRAAKRAARVLDTERKKQAEAAALRQAEERLAQERAKDKAERDRLAKQLAALQAERDRLKAEAERQKKAAQEAAKKADQTAPVTTVKPVAKVTPVTPGKAVPDSTRFSKAYWEKPVRTLKVSDKTSVYSVAFSPDGKRLFTGASTSRGMLWDTDTGRLLSRVSGHRSLIFDAAFSKDGSKLVTSTAVGNLKIWNGQTGKLIKSVAAHSSWVYGVALSPNGQTVATASKDNSARLWDTATGRRKLKLDGFKGEVRDVHFSPSGNLLLTASKEDDGLRFWDPTTGRFLFSIGSKHGFVYSASFSPDGKRVVTSGQKGVHVWDVESRQLARKLAASGLKEEVTFSPDGKLVAVAGYNGNGEILDVATGAKVALLKGHEGSVKSIAFSPDGTRVATGGKDGTVRIWGSD